MKKKKKRSKFLGTPFVAKKVDTIFNDSLASIQPETEAMVHKFSTLHWNVESSGNFYKTYKDKYPIKIFVTLRPQNLNSFSPMEVVFFKGRW